MATAYWRGDAPAVQQEDTGVVGGTIDALNTFTVTINGKALTVVAGSTTAATVATTIAGAFNASTVPEFAEITASVSSATITFRADTAGKPFTLALSKAQAGGATDTHTFTHTAGVVASSGPYDASTVKNYSGGAIPSNGDTLIIDRGGPILYGLDRSAVTLAELIIKPSWLSTNTIGLPVWTGTYNEYRDTFLKIGATSAVIETASGRVKIDFGSAQTAVRVVNSGTALDTNLTAIQLKGTHAGNTLSVSKGSVGVALNPSEVSTFLTTDAGWQTVQASDVTLRFGSGCTLGTLYQTGGIVYSESSFSTVERSGGTLYLDGAAAVSAALYNHGGTVYDRSTGTIALLDSGGVYDCRQDMRAKEISRTILRTGAVFLDPRKRVRFFTPIQLPPGVELADITLDLGSNLTIQRGAV